ncbi:hypothetical protein AA700_1633 [Acidiphilium acidophilum DSM 700]|nr:hypothetical protein AA700_1633 [Acidiphilium acidophilum DSM 700]
MHDRHDRAGQGRAIGLAALAAGALQAELDQRFGGIGFCEGDGAGGEQRVERPLIGPDGDRLLLHEGGEQAIAPRGEGGFAALVGPHGPEQRGAGRAVGGAQVDGAMQGARVREAESGGEAGHLTGTGNAGARVEWTVEADIVDRAAGLEQRQIGVEAAQPVGETRDADFCGIGARQAEREIDPEGDGCAVRRRAEAGDQGLRFGDRLGGGEMPASINAACRGDPAFAGIDAPIRMCGQGPGVL